MIKLDIPNITITIVKSFFRFMGIVKVINGIVPTADAIA